MGDVTTHEMATRARELQEKVLHIDDALAKLKTGRDAAIAELRSLVKRDASLGELLATCGEEIPANDVGNVLVIEDNKTIRLLLNHSLGKGGYAVFEAEDASEAGKLLSEHQIDLIILDYMLPGTNGMQFLEELRGDHDLRHVPVILCTAHHEHGIQERAAALDAKFLPKPINVGELLRMARDITLS